MRCTSCGSENPESKRFCGDCGSPLGSRCASKVIDSDNLSVKLVELFAKQSAKATAAAKAAFLKEVDDDYNSASEMRESYYKCQGGSAQHCTPNMTPPLLWPNEIRSSDGTNRGRFLENVVRHLSSRGNGNDIGNDMEHWMQQLDLKAAMLRTHAALIFPDFVQTVDPLRMMLVGTSSVRLVDGQMLRNLLTCVSKVGDADWKCEPGNAELVENQIFERAGVQFGTRLVDFNSLVSQLPWEERYNSGQPFVDDLQMRYDLLLKSVAAKVGTTYP